MTDLKKIAEESLASQGKLEMEWLLNKLSKIQPKVILEVGVHLGHSLKAWQDAFEPELLIGIDNETNPTLEAYMEDGELQAYLIQADSHDWSTMEEVKEALGGRSVDFLFLDGDHTLNSVRRDWDLYSTLVRSGGIIAFHDAVLKGHPLVDIHRFLKFLKAEKNLKTITYQADANGVGVLYV